MREIARVGFGSFVADAGEVATHVCGGCFFLSKGDGVPSFGEGAAGEVFGEWLAVRGSFQERPGSSVVVGLTGCRVFKMPPCGWPLKDSSQKLSPTGSVRVVLRQIVRWISLKGGRAAA